MSERPSIEPELSCPSCSRVVTVGSLDPIAFSERSTRCPYPSCSEVIVALPVWDDEAPSALYTSAQLALVFRRRILSDVPVFCFVQAILVTAIFGALYAIGDIVSPSAGHHGHYFARAGIGLGALGLALPAGWAALVLFRSLFGRMRENARTIERLSAAPTSERFRLLPARRAYRA